MPDPAKLGNVATHRIHEHARVRIPVMTGRAIFVLRGGVERAVDRCCVRFHGILIEREN